MSQGLRLRILLAPRPTARPDIARTEQEVAKFYDMIIVGGGVTGCATAYFLAAGQFDGTVLIVERDPSYANAPSARAAGGIRQQFSTPENIHIGLFGAEFVKNVDQYLAINGEIPHLDFKERGYLILASPRALPLMRENHAVQRQIGANIAYQSNEDLIARFPWLVTEGLAGGFLGLENEGWLDPYSLLQAFRRKAISLGVTVIRDEVTTLRCRENRVTEVELRSGRSLSPGIVLNAAGARCNGNCGPGWRRAAGRASKTLRVRV
jgi:FAD-dependent oxidoreductase domain-containing protein 1